jgi:hypothetical protein
MRPSSSHHSPLKNSSRSWASLVLFSAHREALERPANGRLAHPHPAHRIEELGPLGVGGPRPLFEILYEQLGGFLVQLRGPAGGLRRLQGAALVQPFAVAFYGGAIDSETAGGRRPWGRPSSPIRRSSILGQANMHSYSCLTRRIVIAICCQKEHSANFGLTAF